MDNTIVCNDCMNYELCKYRKELQKACDNFLEKSSFSTWVEPRNMLRHIVFKFCKYYRKGEVK